MAKQQIRLTESELQNLIAEAVKQELNEGAWDFLRGMGGKVKTDARNLHTNAVNAAQQMGSNMKQSARNIGNRMKQGYNNVKQSAQNYANDVYQAGQMASNQADAQKAIKSIENLVAKGILGRNVANMAIGSLRKYGNQ